MKRRMRRWGRGCLSWRPRSMCPASSPPMFAMTMVHKKAKFQCFIKIYVVTEHGNHEFMMSERHSGIYSVRVLNQIDANVRAL